MLLLLRFISAETRLIRAVKSLILRLLEGFLSFESSSSASSSSALLDFGFLFSREARLDLFSRLEGVTIGVGKLCPTVEANGGIIDADAVAVEV